MRLDAGTTQSDPARALELRQTPATVMGRQQLSRCQHVYFCTSKASKLTPATVTPSIYSLHTRGLP